MQPTALIKLEQKSWRDGHGGWPFLVAPEGVFKKVQKAARRGHGFNDILMDNLLCAGGASK